jgi:hypothetical protein
MSVCLVASCTHVYMGRGRPRRWRKSAEAESHGRLITWLGWLATTWRVTYLTKSVTPPWIPINTPLPVEIRTHTTFWIFHLQSSHSWGATGFLGSSLLECRSSAEILWISIESLCLSTLGEVGVLAYRDHSSSMPHIWVIYPS